MKTLKIADGLSLPLAAVTEKLAWLGRTGSGKTYGAMKLAEQMLEAGAQIGVLDPVGVWRALRVPAEKGGTSYDVVVFGGLYGDLPLDPGAGELVADLVTDRGLSFVLDVSQMIPSEQQRLVRAFADRFFHRRKSAPAAVHLFVEECQEFLPENPSGLEAQTLGVMQRLWKLGRNFGIGGSLISQRPQEIAKKALNMSGTLFAFQMTGPQERKAVRAWVADHGVATDIEAVLQKLTTGEPHVESPTFLAVSKTVRILPRVTADLSSTPQVGAATAARRPLTPIDVEQLKASMAATIEKAKADDPKELKRRIAELEAAARTTARGIHEAGKNLTTEVREVLTDADRELLRTAIGEMREYADLEETVALAIERLRTAVHEEVEKGAAWIQSVADLQARRIADRVEQAGFQRILEKLVRVTVVPVPVPRSAAPAVRMPAAAAAFGRRFESAAVVERPRRPLESNGAAADLPPAKRRILNALAFLEGIGLTQAERNQLAFLSDTTSTSGAYLNNLSALRTAGYLDYPAQGYVRLTDQGRSVADGGAAPSTVAELHDIVRAKVPPAKWRILEVLIAAHPKAVARDELAVRAGTTPSSGAFLNNVSALRTLGLLDYPKQGEVIATPVLFLQS